MSNPSNAKLREEFQEQIDRARKAMDQIDQTHFLSKVLPSLEKLVGQAFVYRRNCYSCPTKKSDYWDTFRKVVACIAKTESSGAWLVSEEFHIDSQGVATHTHRRDWIHSWGVMPTGWQACTLREFNQEKQRTLTQLEYPKYLIEGLLNDAD